MTLTRFPKTQAFKHAIGQANRINGWREMNGEELLPRTIDYIGTTKLHGTNASIRLNLDGSIVVQSRRRTISPGSDNAGFATWVHAQGLDFWTDLLRNYQVARPNHSVTLFGEWAGPGVQKGVALSKFDHKIFVAFDIRFSKQGDDDELQAPLSPIVLEVLLQSMINHDRKMYSIYEGPTWKFTLNLDKLHQNKEQLQVWTEEVEAECPFSKQILGIAGTGEGIFWRPIDSQSFGSRFWFKTKGMKHKETGETGVTIADSVYTEINTFLASVLQPARLEKGIDYLNEMELPLEKRSTGHFLKYISKDVLEEEASTIETNNLNLKVLKSSMQTQARNWYFRYLNQNT